MSNFEKRNLRSSLNVTWRRDLWCHRVIVFWKCDKLLAEQLWQIWRRYAPPFFLLSAKNLRGGGADNRLPSAVRGLINNFQVDTFLWNARRYSYRGF